MTDPLRQFVIVGGGTAGWMAAASLARFVGPGTRILLVESAEVPTVGVGEATIPQIRLLVAALGLEEDRLLADTGGTIKLGIRFEGWSQEGEAYLHAFGPVGRGEGIVPFHQLWLRARAAGLAGPLERYSANAQAAALGRFGREAGPPLAYAYHLDAALLAGVLRAHAEAAGVERAQGHVAGVERNASGDIEAVRLADGRTLAGDFFIDCSGFRSLLLGEACAVGWEDWRALLPCDRALAVPTAPLADPPPFTRAIAHRAGWQWRIPLQHRGGNGIVYQSEAMDDEAARALLLGTIAGAPVGEVRALRFAAGRRRQAWTHNVLALGLASGFLEPLESTSIHLVQSGLARFFSLFPDRAIAPPIRDAYNRATAFEAERIRDFLVLHYWLNARPEPFWRERRTQPLPDTLAAKIETFRAGGAIVRDADELFAEPGWLQVMLGQGLVPDRWSPLADAIPQERLVRHLAAVRDDAHATARRLPAHGRFIADHCDRRSAA